MATVDTIRKYKWPLIGVQVFTALALFVGLLSTHGRPLDSTDFAFVYGSGFLASSAWFPLCYLAWFGRPNIPALTTFYRVVFWLVLALWLVFWVRVASHIWGR